MDDTLDLNVPEFPKRIKNLICEEMEGQDAYIYINEDDDTTITLNPTASAVFDMCNGENSAKDMATVLSEILGAPFDMVLRDVQEVLMELYGFGFFQD